MNQKRKLCGIQIANSSNEIIYISYLYIMMNNPQIYETKSASIVRQDYSYILRHRNSYEKTCLQIP
jgi:hypothetical protein